VSRPKILIVDDRPANLRALAQTLAEVDAEVVQAGSGNEALTACLNHTFSLAILDVQMPGMDGFELAELLRGDPKTAHVPIMFLTAALTDEAHQFRGYHTGAVDYVLKPYQPHVFLGKVRVFLDLERQRNELLSHRERLEEMVRTRTAELDASNQALRQSQTAALNMMEDAVRSRDQFAQAHANLQREMAERRAAEERVRKLNAELEQRVRDRTAELEAANKELEAFSYSVSHDLRAPLRAMDGFSQALLEDCAGHLDARGQDYLARVRAAAARMGALIEDLLKLSRATRAELHRETVDLSALARSVADELRHGDRDRTVEIRVADGLATPGDARLLRIVLGNLMGNAWKFTSRQPQAWIEVGGREIDGAPAFFVRDNGAGFDMQYAAKLFGAFQRLHSAAEFPGTGIGLALVQRIMHRHGGRIWAESTIGEGATFYFTLEGPGVQRFKGATVKDSFEPESHEPGTVNPEP
jgi:signal transduction histidine kinase